MFSFLHQRVSLFASIFIAAEIVLLVSVTDFNLQRRDYGLGPNVGLLVPTTDSLDITHVS